MSRQPYEVASARPDPADRDAQTASSPARQRCPTPTPTTKSNDVDDITPRRHQHPLYQPTHGQRHGERHPPGRE